jgi:hypothetical protein
MRSESARQPPSPCGAPADKPAFGNEIDPLDHGNGKVRRLTGADRCPPLSVTKGRDFEFHDAVDKLIYNGNVLEFEPTGVK